MDAPRFANRFALYLMGGHVTFVFGHRLNDSVPFSDSGQVVMTGVDAADLRDALTKLLEPQPAPARTAVN